ncbi:MAG: DUF523 domain-containing protein [Clostridium sp.]
MYLISACLCGINCRYNGYSSEKEELIELVRSGQGILVCPEQLGGMATPRVPCEIVGDYKELLKGKGQIINSMGENKTKEFIKGAEEVLNLAKRLGVKKAILKESSPSCGCNFIYDGSFSGKKIKGMGITAYLLKENGVKVVSDESYIKGEDEN